MAEEYINNTNKITYIGNIDYRNKMIKFGIKAKDRTRHTYIIGKTGMGKSTLLENLAIQDIQNGEGLAFLDPHGGTAEKLLDFIPEHRKKDVIYFAPFDTEYPVALNVLEKVDKDKRHLVSNGLMAAFKKLFKDQFSARMEYILNNIVLALLENEDETLLGVNRMLTDKDYRKKIVSNVSDPSVKAFWEEEYAKYTDKFAAEAAPAIQNKVGQFISNPLIRNIIGQKKTSFDLRDVMDNRKILIINLSKGKMGEGNANLIGSLLITKIYLAAMSRADTDPYNLEKLPPFYFYVDEFQNFANESFASILSEARKYQLALTVAHQYIEQMTDEVRAAIFGNVGTMITYRVGATDAEIFEKEFAPVFTADDIVNLSAYQFYLRLMIDGVGSKPFSARALLPIEKPAVSYSKDMIEHSRKAYGKEMYKVEEEIQAWYDLGKVQIKKVEEKKVGGNFEIKDNENEKDSFVNKNNHIRSKKPIEIKKENLSPEFLEWQKNKIQINKSNPLNELSEDSPRKQTQILEIKNVNLKEVRENESNRKEEIKENKNSLKEALEKAMREAKNSANSQNTKIESDPEKELEKRKQEEIDEATLRKLVE